MAVLVNVNHERFCQLVAGGAKPLDAYVACGYAPNQSHAGTLAGKAHIKRRIAEILGAAAALVEVSASRIIDEFATLAFHNPADYLTIGEDGMANVDLSTIDREQAKAISEVQSEVRTMRDGSVLATAKVRFTDKRAALDSLAKAFGLNVERHEIGAPGAFADAKTTDEIVAVVRRELGDRDAELFLASLHTSDQASKPH